MSPFIKIESYARADIFLWLGKETVKYVTEYVGNSKTVTVIFLKQEDHDGRISVTWANSFANLLLKFQPSSLF